MLAATQCMHLELDRLPPPRAHLYVNAVLLTTLPSSHACRPPSPHPVLVTRPPLIPCLSSPLPSSRACHPAPLIPCLSHTPYPVLAGVLDPNASIQLQEEDLSRVKIKDKIIAEKKAAVGTLGPSRVSGMQ